MPPGVSRSHVKKRKTSEESEEREGSEEQQSLLAGRQRRSAAMKSHKVWDTLKPGAKSQLEVEDEPQQQPDSSQGGSTKRPRLTPKRASKNTKEDESGAVTPVEVKKEEQPKSNLQQQRPQTVNIVVHHQATEQVIITDEKKSSPTSKLLTHSRQPALKKDQLELIEREMEKHNQFEESEHDEPSDGEDEHPQQTRFVLDDPNDDDYMDFVGDRGRGRGGRGRGRGSRGGGIMAGPTPTQVRASAPRGRPRGGSRATLGGVMRARMMRPPVPMNFYPHVQSRQTNGIYSLQTAGGIVGELSARSAGQPAVRVLRPAGMQMSNFSALRPSSVNISSLNNQQQMAQSNFAVNQELQNYRGRIVAGSSVQEFNDIIDNIVVEYQRVVDDRTRLLASHREYVNHLKLTHQAAQDIKDNKIRHLEQMVDQLQHKTISNIKQEQLRVVKQGTEPGQDAQIQGQQNNQQGNDQGMQQIIVGGGGNDQVEGNQPIGPQAGLGEGGDNQIRPIWRPNKNPNQAAGQRIRILGMNEQSGTTANRRMPQVGNPHDPNALYFDDEMDDEEEFEEDEGDTAEMDDELGAQVTI